MNFTAFPQNVVEFESRFPDESACWELLREAKWPNGFLCARCYGAMGASPSLRLAQRRPAPRTNSWTRARRRTAISITC